jgi:hypothetical protein
MCFRDSSWIASEFLSFRNVLPTLCDKDLTEPDLSSSARFITKKGRDAIIGIDCTDSQREEIRAKPQNLTERLAIHRSTGGRVDLTPNRNEREIRPVGKNCDDHAIVRLSIVTVKPIPPSSSIS